MGEGKFSAPRPHRDEERQIEEAFRQVTGQAPAPQPQRPAFTEEEQIEQAIREVHQNAARESRPQAPRPQQPQPVRTAPPAQQPVQPRREVPPQTPPAAPVRPPRQERYDLIPEDIDSYFDDRVHGFRDSIPENEPDSIDRLAGSLRSVSDFFQKNRKLVMVGACAGILLLIVGFIAAFFTTPADPYQGKILDNVLIADIPVGGMTKAEATTALEQSAGNTYTSLDMLVDLSGHELRLSPRDTGAKLDIKAAVNAAYDYGRTGTKAEQEKARKDSQTREYIIGVLPYLDLDTDYILDVLTDYAEEIGSTLTQPTYGLEGKEPELSADKFDENAPTQTLVITLGTPGIGFDVNDVYDDVLDAYSLHRFTVFVENVESVSEPEEVDLEAIYEEFYIEPVDATVNLQNFKTQPGSYGYGFDLEKAQKLLDSAEFGEEIRIPMEYIAPDLLDNDSFFRDTLGEVKTRAAGNGSRTKNLELACEAINGTVLNPGESLSFSSCLNTVKGFTDAPEDSGREDTPQGGVSQVASTLYYAALLSDLDVTARSGHTYIPSFIDQGLDATAALQLRNSTGFPVQIEAKVSGGYVKIKILGTEERDYYVVMDSAITDTYTPVTEYKEFPFDNAEGYRDGDVIEEGFTGYQIKTYKVKYDTDSGKELSRDFVTTTQYPSANRLVAKVEPEPTTVPTEPPVVETQPPETTVPPETTLPAPEPTEPDIAPPVMNENPVAEPQAPAETVSDSAAAEPQN